jgi:hypothetical protein
MTAPEGKANSPEESEMILAQRDAMSNVLTVDFSAKLTRGRKFFVQ